MKRFLSFINQLTRSPKKMPKIIFDTIKYDVTSITGSNLRNIMLIANKNDINDLDPSDTTDIQYYPVSENDEWKVNVVKELTDVKFGLLNLDNFSMKDVREMLDHICTA